jgi:hypothetical protein
MSVEGIPFICWLSNEEKQHTHMHVAIRGGVAPQLFRSSAWKLADTIFQQTVTAVGGGG